MKLSKRLAYLASETKGYNSLADICCDHGYLGIEAVKKYGLKEVILADINPEPLNQAIENVKRANLETKITCLLGDGLKPLTKPYEVINISGIGGALMVKILTEGLNILREAKKLILSANSEVNLVRKFLMDNKFKIQKETMLFEHKYYEIIIATPTSEKVEYSELELNFGPLLLKEKSEEFIAYYQKQLNLFLNQRKKVQEESPAYLELSKKINTLDTILSN